MEDEIWENVPGFDGCYLVSNLGKIVTIPRVVPCGKCGFRTLTGKEMKLSTNGQGYLKTSLNLKGVLSSMYVHRIVADVFVPNPENKPTVNHKNGIKTDNRAVNLEWATQKENAVHARVTGLTGPVSGKYRPRLTKDQILEIRSMVGKNQVEISKIYGVGRGVISNLISGKNYKNI